MKYFLGFVFVISLYACQTNNQESQSNQQQLIATYDSTSNTRLEVESRNTYSIENESSDAQIAYNEFLLFDSLEKNILPEDFFEKADIQQQLPAMAFPTHIDTAFMEQLANLEWLVLNRNVSEETEKMEIKHHQIPEIADFHIYTSPIYAQDPQLIFTIGKWIDNVEYSDYYAFKVNMEDTLIQRLSSCIVLNRKTFKLSYTQVSEKTNYSTMEKYMDTVMIHQVFTQKMAKDATHPIWEKYWWEVSSKSNEVPTVRHEFYILKENHIYYDKEDYEYVPKSGC
ncbi:MAG: hypothetical protein OHK0038_21760 [Flammeovirgaceae bacterium]